MISKPKSVKMSDLVQARHDRVHKEIGKSRAAKVGKAKKHSPLARPLLEENGWTLYHSGGGCIVWCKSTTAGTMYMAKYCNTVEAEDMTMESPCGVSVMSAEQGECVLNMYFPTVNALLASDIELDGKPITVEPANTRMTFMKCDHCGASTSCKVCMDHVKDFGHLPTKMAK